MEFKDLVAAAKAPRTTTPPSGLPDQLRSELECAICSAIFLDPVILIDCLHTFCGSCVKNWAIKQPHAIPCPSCRKNAKMIRPDYKTASLVELFLKNSPEDVRTEVDIEECRAVYKPGTNIPCPAADEYDEDMEDEEMEDDGGDEDEYFPPPTWTRCPCCIPAADRPANFNRDLRPELVNYTCPISLELDEQQGIAISRNIYKGHFYCFPCGRSVPVVDPNVNNYSCAGCETRNCSAVYNNCAEMPLTKLSDHQYSLIDRIYGCQLFFSLGAPEKTIIEQHLQQMNVDPKDILKLMLRWLKDEDGKVPNVKVVPGYERVDPDTVYVDDRCGDAYIARYFQKWWIAEKEGAGVYDGREKCWYGYECRTMTHRPQHRDRLNHMVNPTPPRERRGNGRAARGGEVDEDDDVGDVRM